MKKVFSVLLALAMLLSVSACGGASDASGSDAAAPPAAPVLDEGMAPEQALAKILELNASFDKVNLEISSSVITDSNHGATEIVENSILRGENIGKEGMRASLESVEQITGSGMKADNKTYYADGVFMMDAQGADLMCQLPVEQAAEQFDTGSALRPAEHLTGLTMTQDAASGTYTLSGSIDIEQVPALAMEYASIAGVGSYRGLVWDPTTYTLVADSQGALVSTALSTGFMFDASESFSVCTVEVGHTFHSTGDGFAVDIPDAAGFTEVTADVLGID